MEKKNRRDNQRTYIQYFGNARATIRYRSIH